MSRQLVVFACGARMISRLGNHLLRGPPMGFVQQSLSMLRDASNCSLDRYLVYGRPDGYVQSL